MLVLGLILVLVSSICVKLFDDKIRPHKERKIAINISFISGLVFIVVGIIQSLF